MTILARSGTGTGIARPGCTDRISRSIDFDCLQAADSIRRGLGEAIAFPLGTTDKRGYRVHVPATVDVRAIRMRLDMTQEEFAGRFGFSVNTLRHWEQGSRRPEGATRAYLLVIERAPDAVRKALRAR